MLIIYIRKFLLIIYTAKLQHWHHYTTQKKFKHAKLILAISKIKLNIN